MKRLGRRSNGDGRFFRAKAPPVFSLGLQLVTMTVRQGIPATYSSRDYV
jgi:hypothetical protein